ncbi:MAG: hypothetical protein FWC88_05460, partial [Endomicrobia bacterium]|nr:hypothetical protein [Endomicrobiia bacterium]
EKIIVDMAQKQSEHRIKMESTVIPSREKQSLRGQWFAFVIALLLILLSGYGFFLGYQVAATIISGGTLTAVVALFLTGKMGQSKQRSEQSKTAE